SRYVDSRIDGASHASGRGFPLASYVVGRSMIRRGADDRQAGRKIDSAFEGKCFERYESLIVVHGYSGVIIPIAANREETVGGKGSKSQISFVASLANRRNDRVLLFSSQNPSVTGVRIEPEHGDARPNDLKIILQTCRKDSDLAKDLLSSH